MLSACNMKILNGSTIGDINGDFTCLRYNGSSVVDYALASHSLIRHVNYIKILKISPLSDHRPLLCSLHPSINMVRSSSENFSLLQDQPARYKWDPETSKDAFIDALTLNQMKLRPVATPCVLQYARHRKMHTSLTMNSQTNSRQ